MLTALSLGLRPRESGQISTIIPHNHGITITYIIGMFVDKNLSDRLTFSNIRGRTSRRIYRPALPLLSPETLSLSSKSRIFLYNMHLALFVRMDDTITRTNASVSIVF